MSGEFLYRMESVLSLYALPYNADEPIICFDEKPYQMLEHLEMPLPVRPGHAAKIDYHYKRAGVCQILCAVEPRAGWRYVEVRERKTKIDYAEFMQALADKYPNAKRIHVVQDNLNTHTPGAFYEAFDGQTARKLTERFVFHHTPVKASWLNIAEIELACLSKNCLERRLPDMKTVNTQLHIRVDYRNNQNAKIDWRFDLLVARQKFKKYYKN
ncbi:MAG TPA: IS630 family transposase [Saprospiraceae bacterium]|nr:IS630 family transposase [Chitinophagales bacterium]HNM25985.1 IS630 family transposase [Saprospiraceae bacterium]